jgi:hypothetical protein
MIKNYNKEVYKYFWGESVYLIHKNGIAFMRISIDNERRKNEGYISEIVVFNNDKKREIFQELLDIAEGIAVKYDRWGLCIDISHDDELVDWFKENDFDIEDSEDGEYSMCKFVERYEGLLKLRYKTNKTKLRLKAK